MVVVVGVAVDDDVGAVWLAIDANTSLIRVWLLL
jgi:hypothetical protein